MFSYGDFFLRSLYYFEGYGNIRCFSSITPQFTFCYLSIIKRNSDTFFFSIIYLFFFLIEKFHSRIILQTPFHYFILCIGCIMILLHSFSWMTSYTLSYTDKFTFLNTSCRRPHRFAIRRIFFIWFFFQSLIYLVSIHNTIVVIKSNF